MKSGGSFFCSSVYIWMKSFISSQGKTKALFFVLVVLGLSNKTSYAVEMPIFQIHSRYEFF